jgi:formiminotetrahydrofolate cyclodeaminase
VLDLTVRLAPIGNPNAASDAGVAAQLASAAVRGAALNVRINLPYLPEADPLRSGAPAELERLEAAAAARERQAVEVVLGRIGPS